MLAQKTGMGLKQLSILSLGILLLSAFVAPISVVHAVGPQALIDGDTVSGSPSLEQTQAEALGFVVTVVTGAQWDAMTQAQFAVYQVLIIGDPTCGYLAISATNNSAVWAPVVMGTAVHTQPGNRILIGTDPVYHHYSHPDATTLIKDGIAFAGALPGRTGVYFDMSCADNGQGLSTLGMLSVGAGSWTENTSPPCGGSVSLIASNPAFAGVTSSGLQGWSCSDHETFPTFQDDWSALAVATDTTTLPVCGTDPDTGLAVCGQPYILIAGAGIVVTSPNIALTPTTSTNPAYTDHTVTATVTLNGTGVSGQLVSFTVTGVNNGATGTCVPASCQTDANGQVTFTYHDTNGPGDDTITASFIDTLGAKEQATAVKHWVTSTPGVPEFGAGASSMLAAAAAFVVLAFVLRSRFQRLPNFKSNQVRTREGVNASRSPLSPPS